jgi:hypothetical protein
LLGDYSCIFCGLYEDIVSFFVMCPTTQVIWQWIANLNNFSFQGNTIEDLWMIDCCIPLSKYGLNFGLGFGKS